VQENILIKVGADISDLAREMGKAKQEVSDFGTRMSNLGKNLQDIAGGVALSFGAMAAGIALPLKQAVQTSVDFDTAMRRAATIAGATSEEFDALKQTALDLGASTTKSAQEVAVAMSEMAAKGYDVNQIIAAMPGVIAAAEASGEDLALTADTVSSAINAFGLKAEDASRVADILAQSANDTAAGIADLQYAFKYAAGPAAQLGYSIESVTAAVGIMVDAGLAGEQAGTSLRAALLRLVNPPKQAADELNKLGVSITDQNGNMRSLSDIIGDLNKSMDGYTDAQKASALAAIFGTEAVSGMMALVAAGPDKIDAMTESLENSAGASAEAAKQMMGGLGGAIEQMNGAFETMRIIIGDHLSPIIQRAVEFITRLVEAFNNAPPGLQKFIAVSAMVLAALTGLIAVIGAVAAGIGLFIMSIAPIIPALTKVGGALKAVGGSLAFLISPIGIAVLAVGALIGGFIALYNKSEPFRESVNKIGAALKGAFIAGVEKASEVLSRLKDVFGEIAKTKIVPFFESVADVISRAFSGDFSGVAQMFGQLVPTIIGFLVGGIPALILAGARFLPAIAEGMQQNLPALLNGITAVITKVITAITTYLPMFVQSGVDMLTKLIEGLTTAIPLILPTVITIVTTLITTLVQFLPQFVQAGVTVLTNILNGIVNSLPLIVTAILTLVTTILSVIAENLPLIITAGIQILTALIEGILTILPALLDATLMILQALVKVVIDNLPLIITAGIEILMALIDGIITILPSLISAAVLLIYTIADTLIKNLPKIIDAGLKILLAVIEGILDMLPELVTTGVNLIVKLAQTLIENLPKIIEAGIKVITSIIKGIGEALPDLLEAGVGVIKDLASELLAKAPGMLKDVGKAVVEGIWEGIKSLGDWLKEKVSGFFGGIVDWGKKVLGINSPSRVIRDQVGRWIPAGLVDGINREKNNVIKAAEQMAQWATPDVPDVAIAYSTPSGLRSSLSSAVSGTVDVNTRDDMLAAAINRLEQSLDGMTIVMDGERVGQLVRPHVNEGNAVDALVRRYFD
jgi:TP901 family phage tail tape measure protein